MSTGQEIKAVEIVAAPVGEAPLWVREAWIGLTLPLVSGFGSMRHYTGVGVLSAPRTAIGLWWYRLTGRIVHIDGYLVDRAAAFQRLEEARPDAAAWWRTEARLDAIGQFIFDAPACRPVHDD